jgi:hypothetical protein
MPKQSVNKRKIDSGIASSVSTLHKFFKSTRENPLDRRPATPGSTPAVLENADAASIELTLIPQSAASIDLRQSSSTVDSPTLIRAIDSLRLTSSTDPPQFSSPTFDSPALARAIDSLRLTASVVASRSPSANADAVRLDTSTFDLSMSTTAIPSSRQGFDESDGELQTESREYTLNNYF